jgi:hypothetical protein
VPLPGTALRRASCHAFCVPPSSSRPATPVPSGVSLRSAAFYPGQSSRRPIVRLTCGSATAPADTRGPTRGLTAGRPGGTSPGRVASHSRAVSQKKKGKNPRSWMPWLFSWGLSSKSPKPPLDRFRAGCKPRRPAPPSMLTSGPKTPASMPGKAGVFFFQLNELN